MKRKSGKKKRMHNSGPKPEYSLKEVKRLAMESRVLFVDRSDGKATPANIGLTEAQARAIITRLRPSEYDITPPIPPDKDRPVDVYKTTLHGKTLYVKFQITETGDLLVVVSFHL